MLVLTRRIGEALTVGDDVTVTVLSVSGSHVRNGYARLEGVTF